MINKSLKFYQKKRVLVTGGLGFIGSTLAMKLVDLGARVTIIDSLISSYGGNLFNIKNYEKKLQINISDVRDKFSFNYLIKNKDVLFNLAGTLSHVDSMKNPFTDLEINCNAQLSILESCRQFNPKIRIIYAGTRNQYGKPLCSPVDENHPLNPTDINGINCIAGESYHLLYYKIYKIKSCSLRMTNTFGPRHQMKHSRQGVLNWFIRKIIDGETVKIYGDGSQIRDTNYVDDVVNAFLLAGSSRKSWGHIFNLGGTPISLKNFVKKVIKINKKGKYQFVPFPPGRRKIEIGNYSADYSKIKKILGWKPKTSIERGIKKTLNFYKKYKKHYWQ